MKSFGTICSVLLCIACRGPAAWSPEALVLNDNANTPALVEATIGGMVYCSTCQPGSSMLMTLNHVTSASTTQLAQQPFDRVGAFEFRVRVAPHSQLLVHAQVFAGGGILTSNRQVDVPEGEGPVALTVNLMVP